MNTKIKRKGDTIVVSVDGRLSFEAQEPLKEHLRKLIHQSEMDANASANTRPTGASAFTDSVPSKIIFNFENLEFVGSSGISSFVQTLRDFNHKAPTRPRYCHVKSEFQRVIRAFDDEELFEFYEDEELAKKSFDQ